MTHKYKCTKVITEDYGDGPAAGTLAIAHFSIIPDGSDWRSRPSALTALVPVGTRPEQVTLEIDFILKEEK